jgi:hypothetical protein
MRFKKLITGAMAFAVLGALAGVAVGASHTSAARASTSKTSSFERNPMRLDWDSTKGEFQVFIDTDVGAPLKTLDVFAPDGVTRILHLKAKDFQNLGQTEIVTETHEALSLAQIEKAYPAGTYSFVGTTFAGDTLTGSWTLADDLLSPPVITSPTDAAKNVPTSGLVGSWSPVPNVTSYHIELQTGDFFSDKKTYFPDLTLSADLLPNITSFAFPSGSVLPHKDYTFEVTAVGAAGNTVDTSVDFSTGN